jgi:glutamyl-tRNA reductase
MGSAVLWRSLEQRGTKGQTRVRDNIILLGTNHTRAAISVRERLSLSADAQRTAFLNKPFDLSAVTILSTCNRSEYYAVAPNGANGLSTLESWVAEITGVRERDLANVTYTLAGRDAVAHLFEVSAGLDSMILGEPHILGQVRTAFHLSMETGVAGPILSRLGQDAVHVGKFVRTQTALSRNRMSIPHAAVDLASTRLMGLHRRKAVVIGAGEMGSLSAKVLRSSGIGELVVVNRDESRGRFLAGAVGGRFTPFNELHSEFADADLVISAVSIDGYLLRPSDLKLNGHQSVLVDLGIPRTIDPALREVSGVQLFDIDDLERFSADRRESSEADVERARSMVAEARDVFLRWWAARESAPAIAELSAKAEQIRAHELERALRKLDHLSDRDRNVVAALSAGIVNKLLHEPISTLRGSLDGGETTSAMRKLFALAGESEHAPRDVELTPATDQNSRDFSWDKHH